MDFPLVSARFRLAHLLPAVGLAVILAGFGASGWVAVAAAALLWGLLGSLHTGLQISPDRQHSRDYWGLGRWRVGSWRPLPPVVGITLKYYATLAKGGRSATSWGVWKPTSHRHEELVLMLSLHHRATGLIVGRCALDDVNAAIDFAHELADYFDVPVHQHLPPHLFESLPPAAGRIGPGKAR